MIHLGVIHSIETTSANVHDIVVTDKILHGKEERVWTDAGYTGIESAKNMKRKVNWHIAMKLGKRAKLPESHRTKR